jgi:hypothetical protein
MSDARKKIGRYELGIRKVDVYGRPGTGGDFSRATEENGIAEINVGMEEKEWADTISILLHESAELAIYDMRCRYNPDPDFSRDHGNYIFLLTHEQFSEIIARVAWFISRALPDVASDWNARKESKVVAAVAGERP